MSHKPFDLLPKSMQNSEVARYLQLLDSKKGTLFFKRLFDVVLSALLLVITSPVLLLCALAVKLDSPGPVFYRQQRVGRYNQIFRIFKFRSMVVNADKLGPHITVGRDPRITRVGRFLRITRLDEFVQLINVIIGDMSMVGPRPEVRRYVDVYSDERLATLLIRPGITGSASIEFKDENAMLEGVEQPEKVYINEILPVKMDINLRYLRDLSLWEDLKILCNTVLCIF